MITNITKYDKSVIYYHTVMWSDKMSQNILEELSYYSKIGITFYSSYIYSNL